MGKRKRKGGQNKTSPPLPPPGLMPCSFRMDALSDQKSYQSIDTSTIKPLSSIMDIMDSSLKVPTVRHSHLHHHHNNRRAPRNFYGHQYSRRNSASHAETSTSRGKGTPLRNEQQSFKLASQPKLDSGCYTDSRDRFFRRPERIRSSSSAMDAISPDVVKMVCGICQKLLRRRPYILENTISSSDVSVVAVLVCGHVYHADCLEQRTCHEDRRDPACPLCLGHDDASRG